MPRQKNQRHQRFLCTTSLLDGQKRAMDEHNSKQKSQELIEIHVDGSEGANDRDPDVPGTDIWHGLSTQQAQDKLATDGYNELDHEDVSCAMVHSVVCWWVVVVVFLISGYWPLYRIHRRCRFGSCS